MKGRQKKDLIPKILNPCIIPCFQSFLAQGRFAWPWLRSIAGGGDDPGEGLGFRVWGLGGYIGGEIGDYIGFGV